MCICCPPAERLHIDEHLPKTSIRCTAMLPTSCKFTGASASTASKQLKRGTSATPRALGSIRCSWSRHQLQHLCALWRLHGRRPNRTMRGTGRLASPLHLVNARRHNCLIRGCGRTDKKSLCVKLKKREPRKTGRRGRGICTRVLPSR